MGCTTATLLCGLIDRVRRFLLAGGASVPYDGRGKTYRMSDRRDRFVASRFCRGLIVASFLCATLGFGGCGDDGPKLFRVTGQVKYNGEPVIVGSVVYLPRDPGVGRQATGQLDEEGKFALTTFQSGDGVKAGEYDVIVLAFDKPPGDPTREELEALQGKAWRKPTVPPRYTMLETTDLSDVIDRDHPGHRVFELSD